MQKLRTDPEDATSTVPEDYQIAIRQWKDLVRLPSDEAEEFAVDMEDIHRTQPPVTSAWD